MQHPTGSASDETDKSRPSSMTAAQSGGSNAPLVIVSERGRHSDESRRIVRAQAARASAAQSRVTRARNRGEREGTVRETPLSPGIAEAAQLVDSTPSEGSSKLAAQVSSKALVIWFSDILNTPVASLISNAESFADPSGASASGSTSPGSATAMSFGAFLSSGSTTAGHRPQLPPAIPRGFTTLQQSIQLSEPLMTLTGRTACFDFHSPGFQERLHGLLMDLILGYSIGPIISDRFHGHRIQDYLRIACICLTIFQGQRADSAVLAYQDKYNHGLEAAWSETMSLHEQSLMEPKAAEASMWAIFVICVTTGSTTESLRGLLRNLFDDLQLMDWIQVRGTLLEFIYPVSFLDEPCRLFYDNVRRGMRS